MSSKKQSVTYIDDIIDLDSSNQSNDIMQKVDRENLDRNSYFGPIKNKLRTNVDHRLAMNGGIPQPQTLDYFQYQPQQPQYQQPPPQQYHTNEKYMYGPKVQYNFQDEPAELNCIDVSKHITGCPICSKFYENDKSSYVIFIVILIIIIIILFKKVLEKE